MATIFLSIATPPQMPQSQHHFYGTNRVSIAQRPQTPLLKSLFKPITSPLRSSSPNSTSVSVLAEEEKEETSPPSDDLSLQSESTPPQPISLLSGCKACGREEIENGCNGEGRIQGGIATVPGFGWWPIKAYRPCPGFVAAGGRYRRRGQTMDEVASGRGERVVSMSTDQEPQSRKKDGPRKFKK